MEVRRNGRFTSLFDFASRFEPGVFGKSGLERLIMAGAFDSLKPNDVPTSLWRAKLFAGIEPAIAFGQRTANDRMRGQSGLFGGGESATPIEDELPDVEPWTQTEISRHEKTATGLYLSVHPLDSFTGTLADMRIEKIADHKDLKPGDRLQLAGIISGSSVKYSKKGNRFCIFQLEDQSTGVKCLVWAEAYGKFGGLIKNDELIIASGKVESVDGNEITFIVDDVQSLSEAVPKTATSVSITLPSRIADVSHFEEIFEMLSKNHGKCDVYLSFPIGDVEVELHSAPIRVKGSKDLETQLRSRGCEVNWKII
jgi:DNA polymerase-3 subunit alpha